MIKETILQNLLNGSLYGHDTATRYIFMIELYFCLKQKYNH